MSEFRHIWIGRNFLPERHGQPCRVVASHYGKHVLEFADGFKVATVRGTFRKQKPAGEAKP